jgi:S-adenosylmethionine:tRNA ribosyltransferase-isomerase
MRGEGHSVAAPTAGLHFTPELLARLEAQGIRRATVELDVGMGTFLPVETDTLEEHPMHTERYRIPASTITTLRDTRAAGRRIVAVGTTAVRTLEAAAAMLEEENRRPGAEEISGETDLKIGPGYQFRMVDALITNFHLPKSTLMALVAAFLGNDGVARLKSLYAQAISEQYRFYSYGDAMFIC